MKIIAHRVNNWKPVNRFGVYGAEIDVQVSNDGKIRAFHEPNESRPGELDMIFDHSGYDKFFVDIKQNLDVEWLKKIVKVFGNRLLGLFDVPHPSAYYAHEAKLPIWDRLSEYEAVRGHGGISSKKFWLDPLRSWSPGAYGGLLNQVPKDGQVIICSPELHGRRGDMILDCWEWARNRVQVKGDERIFGIVTKKSQDAKEFFSKSITAVKTLKSQKEMKSVVRRRA